MCKTESGHPVIKITDFDESSKFPDKFLTFYAEEESGSESCESGDQALWCEVKKGAKKRLTRMVNSLRDVFESSPGDADISKATRTVPKSKESTRNSKKQRSFKAIKYLGNAVLICTFVLASGWTTSPPVTVKLANDLRTEAGQAEAWELQQKARPG